jgi:hypothetical protein
MITKVAKIDKTDVHDTDVLDNLTGGCVTILPKPIDLEVCYSYDSSKQEVCVSAKLAGMEMGKACLNASKPSVNFCLSLAVVKACLTLTFDIKSLCLKYEAKACYWALTWHCATHTGTVVCF